MSENKYTIICGVCEYEWSADGQREEYPFCGCRDEYEDHVICNNSEQTSILETINEQE